MLGYARILHQVRGEDLIDERDLGIGDLVRLRSGGLVMVVEGKAESGSPMCVWADKGGEVHRDSFDAVLLVGVRRRKWFGG